MKAANLAVEPWKFRAGQSIDVLKPVTRVFHLISRPARAPRTVQSELKQDKLLWTRPVFPPKLFSDSCKLLKMRRSVKGLTFAVESAGKKEGRVVGVEVVCLRTMTISSGLNYPVA